MWIVNDDGAQNYAIKVPNEMEWFPFLLYRGIEAIDLWSTMRRSKVASGSLLFTRGSKIIIKTNTHQCQRQQRCTAQHAQASSWVEWIFSYLLCLKDKLDTTNRDENKITLSECVRIHHNMPLSRCVVKLRFDFLPLGKAYAGILLSIPLPYPSCYIYVYNY